MQITPFKIVAGVATKTKSSLFTSLSNYSKYDYGSIRLTVSKTDGGKRSDGSDRNEIDCKSLIMQFRAIRWPILIGLPGCLRSPSASTVSLAVVVFFRFFLSRIYL